MRFLGRPFSFISPVLFRFCRVCRANPANSTLPFTRASSCMAASFSFCPRCLVILSYLGAETESAVVAREGSQEAGGKNLANKNQKPKEVKKRGAKKKEARRKTSPEEPKHFLLNMRLSGAAPSSRPAKPVSRAWTSPLSSERVRPAAGEGGTPNKSAAENRLSCGGNHFSRSQKVVPPKQIRRKRKY